MKEGTFQSEGPPGPWFPQSLTGQAEHQGPTAHKDQTDRLQTHQQVQASHTEEKEKRVFETLDGTVR